MSNVSLKRDKPKLVDSHAHTQFPDYNEDRADVIRQALNAGIWMVNAGANPESSEKAVRLAEKYKEGVYATVGIHPSESSRFKAQNSKSVRNSVEELRLLAGHPKCVAIGECGLAYFPAPSEEDKRLQAELFTAQINLAHETRRPLVIHCRDAYSDLYEVLRDNEKSLLPDRPALMHFFSGTINDADKFLEMGFMFSFGGAVTFPLKSGKTDFVSLIKRIPIKAILLETDCPYVSPAPLRGRRNEPSYVVYVAAKLAEIKGTETKKLAKATTENALRFFAIGKASR